jgi:putative oxidoreductase
MDALQRFGPLAGRIMLGLIFVMSGFGKVTGFEGTVGYVASKGLPMPQVLAAIGAVVELGGGLLLILGWKARLAGALLFVFTAVAGVLFHNFWAAAPEQAQGQMIHFMKNLSIMGGMLYVVVYGSGPLAVDKTDDR